MLLVLVASTGSALAEWTEASTRHFILFAELPPDQLQQAAEQLERYDQAMRFAARITDADRVTGERVTLFLVKNATQVQRLTADGGPVTGIYLPRAGGPGAIAHSVFRSQVRSGRLSSGNSLLHEYAHHVLLNNRFPDSPLWLSEGGADFYATMTFTEDGGATLGLPRMDRAYSLLGERIPLKELLSTQSNDGHRVYTQGWLLVHYLTIGTGRQEQIDEYLSGLRQGMSGIDAGTAAFGDLKVLERNLQAYIEQPLRLLDIPAEALKPDAVTLRRLSAGEQAIMKSLIASRLRIDNRGSLLRKFRDQAAPFPNDARVQAALARAAFDAGKHADALAAAERAIAADGNSAQAYIYKGRALMAMAQSAQARACFETAANIEPDNPEPAVLRYLSFPQSGETADPATVAGLKRAATTAPADERLAWILAYQHLAEADVAGARRVLYLLTISATAPYLGINAPPIFDKLNEQGIEAARAAFKEETLQWW